MITDPPSGTWTLVFSAPVGSVDLKYQPWLSAPVDSATEMAAPASVRWPVTSKATLSAWLTRLKVLPFSVLSIQTNRASVPIDALVPARIRPSAQRNLLPSAEEIRYRGSLGLPAEDSTLWTVKAWARP